MPYLIQENNPQENLIQLLSSIINCLVKRQKWKMSIARSYFIELKTLNSRLHILANRKYRKKFQTTHIYISISISSPFPAKKGLAIDSGEIYTEMLNIKLKLKVYQTLQRRMGKLVHDGHFINIHSGQLQDQIKFIALSKVQKRILFYDTYLAVLILAPRTRIHFAPPGFFCWVGLKKMPSNSSESQVELIFVYKNPRL